MSTTIRTASASASWSLTSGHAGSNESRLYRLPDCSVVITTRFGNYVDRILESIVIVLEVSLHVCDSVVTHGSSFNVLLELQQQMASLDGFRETV